MSALIQPTHLARRAYVYIRQSSLAQVLEHQESTALQYHLAQRAQDLGWPPDQVSVIDEDQGQSAVSTHLRPGFQQLAAEVSLGHVGLILGVEVSRLARSCADWHRLLELCALSHTLLADTVGVYDPNTYNDRLLLGLKGTFAEAELHLLRGRLIAARYGSKATWLIDPLHEQPEAIREIAARHTEETAPRPSCRVPIPPALRTRIEELLLAGNPDDAVAKHLNDEGWSTRTESR